MSEPFTAIVYLLCGLASAICAALLARSYRRSRARLLLWSALCFTFLAANNLLVIIDLLVLPSVDLRLLRLLLSFAAGAVLMFGLIWDVEE